MIEKGELNMKYAVVCLGVTDEEPEVKNDFAAIKMYGGNQLLIPMIMLQNESTDILRQSIHTMIDRIFDGLRACEGE